MKINGIKALDYQCQGDSLTLVLSETTFDAVSNLNTALVEVRTDDGDLVEAHGGYALRAITYDKDKQTYTVACTTAADDTTAQAITKLASKGEELETSNTALAAQADYNSMMTDTEVAYMVNWFDRIKKSYDAGTWTAKLVGDALVKKKILDEQ